MKFISSILYISLFLFFKPLSAQVHTWTGAGNGIYWSDPLNWDQGTRPLTNGVGTVIIPTGATVTSINVINFEYGEITGGGTLINNGTFNSINASEVQTSKIISNITFENHGNINTSKATGIINDDPLVLDDGTQIISSNTGNININNVGITTTTTLNPGYLDIIGPIWKIGAEDTVIDAKLKLCCYDVNVEEGSLTIESRYGNLIQSPRIYVSPGAGLILSGDHTFGQSGGISIEGLIEGYFEIRSNNGKHPTVQNSVFFAMTGELNIVDATFVGVGNNPRVLQRMPLVVAESSNLTLDNLVFSNQEPMVLNSMSSLIINNGAEFRNGAHLIINEATILGSNGGIFRNHDLINIIGISATEVFDIHFCNWNGVLDIGESEFIVDDSAAFTNYNYQDPPFNTMGEVIGSGTFKFPTYDPQTVNNDGRFLPGPETATMNCINFSQSELGLLTLDIDSLSDYDIISNSGTTHFEGGFDVTLNFPPSIGDEFEVLISDSSITNCQPVSTTSATYNGLNYVFDVICNTSSIVLRLGAILDNPSFTEENLQFYTYPNPSEGVINFEYNTALLSNFENPEVVIYNYIGQDLKQLPIASESYQLDISQFSSGVYFAKLISEKKVLAITKIVMK